MADADDDRVVEVWKRHLRVPEEFDYTVKRSHPSDKEKDQDVLVKWKGLLNDTRAIKKTFTQSHAKAGQLGVDGTIATTITLSLSHTTAATTTYTTVTITITTTHT